MIERFVDSGLAEREAGFSFRCYTRVNAIFYDNLGTGGKP